VENDQEENGALVIKHGKKLKKKNEKAVRQFVEAPCFTHGAIRMSDSNQTSETEYGAYVR